MTALKRMAVILWLLNLFDALATWYAVCIMKYAVEVNPMMASAIKHGVWCFFMIKIGVMSVSCLFLYRIKPGLYRPWIANSIFGIAILIYVLIDIHHVFGLIS